MWGVGGWCGRLGSSETAAVDVFVYLVDVLEGDRDEVQGEVRLVVLMRKPHGTDSTVVHIQFGPAGVADGFVGEAMEVGVRQSGVAPFFQVKTLGGELLLDHRPWDGEWKNLITEEESQVGCGTTAGHKTERIRWARVAFRWFLLVLTDDGVAVVADEAQEEVRLLGQATTSKVTV